MSDSSTWCPQCGPDVSCDEDGCCATCGAACTGEGAEQAERKRDEAARLRDELDQARDELDQARDELDQARDELDQARDEARAEAECARIDAGNARIAWESLRAKFTEYEEDVDRERYEARVEAERRAVELGAERDEARTEASISYAIIENLRAERDELIDRHGELVNDAFLDRDALRAQLAKYEEVVQAAMKWRAADLDRRRPPHEGRPLLDALADTCDALREFDNLDDSSVGVAATAEDGHAEKEQTDD